MCIFLSRFKITKVPERLGAFYLAQFSNSGLKFLKFSMCCSMTRLKMNILYKWSKRKAPFHSEKMVRSHPPIPPLSLPPQKSNGPPTKPCGPKQTKQTWRRKFDAFHLQTFGFADNTEAAKVTFWQGIYLFSALF